MTFRIPNLAIISFAIIGSISLSTTAQESNTQASSSTVTSSVFVKKRYSINGNWSVINIDGVTQIYFSEDFKTKGGPDLKVYLSEASIEELDSKTAANSAINIGVLKSKSGKQIYTIPDDVNLSDYKSLIIHCEAFSVLWGGFDLPKNADGSSLMSKP